METDRAILDLVRSSGVVSRVELAEQSGLAGASISRIVKRLLDERLLIEVGEGDPTGGKRRTLLELNTPGRFAVGISIDATQLTYVLVNLPGEVVGEYVSAGIGQDEPRVVVARVAREVADLLHRFDVDRGDVSGLGVAIAGRLDARRLVMRGSLQATEWEQFALEAALEEALGLPVTLEHDYVCAALGEFWVGRVPATADFACFYMATGFGFGLILEGEVYRGSSHNAGEVGHVILDVDGPECWCGSRGCLEALAGPRTVVRRAAAQPELVARLGLTGREDDVHADFAAVASAAADGDLEALELVEDSAHYVAAAILSLTNVLDLDRIVLSGPGFADAAGVYVRAAQSAVAGLAFVRQVHPVTIELSQLGLKSAATGAATVALHGSLGRAAPAPRRGQGGDALRRRPRIALVGPAL